jgi:hypothetical protein
MPLANNFKYIKFFLPPIDAGRASRLFFKERRGVKNCSNWFVDKTNRFIFHG